MEEQPIDYEEFLARLDLPDDKTSNLLYDLYKYEINEDKRDNTTDRRKEL